MKFNLEQWIEEVRQKPEHVRIRYVLGCVAASMVLVVSVWLLSVSENFKHIANEKEAGEFNQILPKPSDFSLDALIQNKQTLGAEGEIQAGEDYFEDQYQGKTAPKMNDEGMQPKATSK